ncbi:cation diffusion facilitator family transporter [Pseudohalocynthiibacter aestuariivivens]|uniref:Cation diffusion facilitator family transporter n=1 Tax=Pseudohalocynthiibacter aestuariivivens TaxID=1591409 RepID=A0ABV5JAW8_9RHOB|nr:cation diffusion facilitator family transporter [Pseudohalocynthiibacter aestuariivivens]MBS9715959.1 cation diffusion facilitator family transporter [Pseudohalocynthiibacter aestuariivivens]
MKNAIDPHKQRLKLSLSAGALSVSVALVLVFLKVWALRETGALSIAASAADSALDLIVSLAGLTAIIYAARPPDEDHAFGHTSAEDLVALGQAVFILISAGAICWAAISRLTSESPVQLNAEGRGMVVMIISISLTVLLLLWQRHVVRRTSNAVVQADSVHYLADLIPSIGALVSLWVSSRYGFASLDSFVALGAAGLLFFGGTRIGKKAWDALMDRNADLELIAAIEAIITNWPGVLGYHDLKSRTAGSKVYINLHLELDGDLSLKDAHAIGAALKRDIISRYPEVDLIIHKDPV